MSYNISAWKTKKIENLIIPLSAFFKHKRSDWHPEINNNSTKLKCGCEQEIKGEMINGAFHVHSFAMSGEGSGTFYEWILEPALRESTGILEATLIWEGGDSVSRLTVKNGKVENLEIEL